MTTINFFWEVFFKIQKFQIRNFPRSLQLFHFHNSQIGCQPWDHLKYEKVIGTEIKMDKNDFIVLCLLLKTS